MTTNDINDEILSYDQIYLEIDDSENIKAEWITEDTKKPIEKGRVPSNDSEVVERINTYRRQMATTEFRHNVDQIKIFGQDLFSAIFPEYVGDLFKNAFAKLEEKIAEDKGRGITGRRLRVIIQVDENSKVYHWPLEFLRYRKGDFYLAASELIVLSRCAQLAQTIDKRALDPKDPPIDVLLVVSRPGQSAKQGGVICAPVERDLFDWNQAISGGLDPRDQKIKVRVLGCLTDGEKEQGEEYGFEVYQESATSANLKKHLLPSENWKPDVLHFIGHGRYENNKGELGLMSEKTEGELDWKDADHLKPILKVRQPRLLVLQACEGADSGWEKGFISLADQIYKMGIPAVVAMQYKVENICATTFSSGFYEALREYSDIDEAVQRGRIKVYSDIMLKNLEFNLPVLFALKPGKLLLKKKKDRSGKYKAPKPVEEMSASFLAYAEKQVTCAIRVLEESSSPGSEIQMALTYLNNAYKRLQQCCSTDADELNFVDSAIEFFQEEDWGRVLDNLKSAQFALRKKLAAIPSKRAELFQAASLAAPAAFQKSPASTWGGASAVQSGGPPIKLGVYDLKEEP